METEMEDRQSESRSHVSMSELPETKKTEEQKVPYVKGEKTIICWNCQSILLVKDDWTVIQCTNCQKINRIPGHEKPHTIQVNENLNHFDLNLPYVFIIITCPFCKTDNKCRKDAEHVVCYRCKNSVTILQEQKVTPPLQNQFSSNPPPKSIRISDLFFPDPMFYPGFYPSGGIMGPYSPYSPPPMHDFHNHMAHYNSLTNNVMNRRLMNIGAKNLLDSQGDIDARRERQYRDLIKGRSYNQENYGDIVRNGERNFKLGRSPSQLKSSIENTYFKPLDQLLTNKSSFKAHANKFQSSLGLSYKREANPLKNYSSVNQPYVNKSSNDVTSNGKIPLNGNRFNM